MEILQLVKTKRAVTSLYSSPLTKTTGEIWKTQTYDNGDVEGKALLPPDLRLTCCSGRRWMDKAVGWGRGPDGAHPDAASSAALKRGAKTQGADTHPIKRISCLSE